ncbi:hypothetical protein RUM44_011668 [Polyplax serrata]|uniref:Cilia- and flagella-associated protein 57 n=1 Tax=Polyplax serrata TaxID=468196 RepID=A0ABR1AQR0_POLSC
MATAEITPRVVFSLRHQVRHNAHYISDFQILYPAGSVLIMHNFVEKRQRHIKLFEKSVFLEMIVVSPSRKFAAIIQNSEKGQILVFDMQTLKKRRVLNLPHESVTNRFETLAFTHDDMYIMAITGEPDWNMVCYNWTKGKVSSVTKAIHPGTSVTQVCCSPVSNGEIFLIGHNLFRLMSLNETVWRQYGFQKVDQLDVTSGAWLSGDTVICGTSDAKLFFVENGELKGVFNAFNSLVINIKDKDEVQFQQVTSSSLLTTKKLSNEKENSDLTVRTIIAFPKGFAYSCGIGLVHLFEKDKNKYKKRNVFVIEDPIVQDLHGANINVVKHLSINVSQDKLLATTNRAQLYMVRLWGPDLNVAPQIPFRHLGEILHNGPINGLALCVWKPIFATSGKFDRTVQIWNFETETVQIVKRYTEDIYCIDIHPTGTFMAIGFADRVDFSLILMNDVQCGRRVPFRNISSCLYSNQGNYLGLASENVVEIYSTVMYSSVHILKGHIGNVSRMQWTIDDKRLVTCGIDGYILTWDIIKGELMGEIVTPGVCYLDIAVPGDGKVIYAVGDDGLIKEIVDGTIMKAVGLNQTTINNITLSRSNALMFLSSGTSDVMSVKMPLTDPPDFTLYPFHASKVTQIKISFDDSTLITVSDGGSIILWKLSLGEEKTVAVDKNFMYSTEVLINKTQLEQHIHMMKNLSQKLYEMEMGQAREMRDTENRYSEKIKEMHENYASLIEELKEKIEETETVHRKQLVNMGKEVEQLRETQENEKKTMIDNYTSKLKVEYEKVQSLDSLKEVTVRNFDEMVEDLTRCKEEETNELIRLYEQKLLDVDNALKESHEENQKNIEEHEISKQYVEDDADRELVETKAKYEKILKEEKEQNATLKDEAIHMRKKFAEAHKERIEFRVKLEHLQGEQQKLQSNIQALEKDITDLKTEIVERDSALKEKDEKIILLKKRIQEMEKYKFVLDYKIKELNNQIDPKDREIRERKEEILDMETELANLKKINSSLELQVTELKEKIAGTEKEVINFERLQNSSSVTLKQMKIDIYSLYQELTDYKKLKDGIMKLYHKYNRDDVTVSKDMYGDTDAQRDFVIQREFLEKTILALRSTLDKSQQNKTDRRKVLQDNVILLEELNNIRKQMKETVTAVRNLERMIGMKYNKSMAPSEAYGKMQQALKKQEEIKDTYKTVINEAETETNELTNQARHKELKLMTLLHGETADT